MKIFYSSFILLILASNLIMAQEEEKLKATLPPPPGVAELEKYGSVPVAHYTGVPNISIPIFTLTSKSASVPISLSYHAQGIKVNDVSGPVGLGWALNAGGYITKYINGLRDGLYGNPSGFSSKTEISNFLDEHLSDEHLSPAGVEWEEIYCHNFGDLDADVYSFLTPGGSGKFFYDASKTLRQMPIQNFSIITDNVQSNSVGGYIIRDKNGVDYNFNTEDVEKQGLLSKAGIPWDCLPIYGVTETAKLSSVTSFDGGEITFYYEPNEYSYWTNHNEMKPIKDGTVNLDISGSNQWSGVDIKQGKRLDRIHTKEGYDVKFKYFDNGGPGKLERIIISFKGKEFKWFDFSYNGHPTKDGNTPFIPVKVSQSNEKHYNGRDRLISITESGKGKTEFVYNNLPLPPRFSYAQDFWGYYNGADHNFTAIPDIAPNGDPYYANFPTGNRQTDETSLKAGILNQIIYPTGGSTTFVFEANKREVEHVIDECIENPTQFENFFEAQSTSSNCSGKMEGSYTINIPANSSYIKVHISSNTTATNPAPLNCVDGEEMNKVIIEYGPSQAVFNGKNQIISLPDGFTGAIDVDYLVNGVNSVNEFVSTSIYIEWKESSTECPEPGNSITSFEYLGGLRLSAQFDSDGVSPPLTRTYVYDDPIYVFPDFDSKRKSNYSTEILEKNKIIYCWYPFYEFVNILNSNSVTTSSNLFGGSVAYNKVSEQIGSEGVG